MKGMDLQPHLSDWDSLREFFIKRQTSEGKSESTIGNRDHWIRHFSEWLDDDALRPVDITHEHVDEWVHDMVSQGKSPTTVNCKTSAVTLALRKAGHPLAETITVKEAKGLPNPVGEDELITLLHECSEPTRSFIILGAFAGLRVAEIAGLDESCVKNGELRIVGKGKRVRMVPIHKEVRKVLKNNPPPYITRNGNSYRPSYISRAIKRRMDWVGVDNSAHGLRHRFATQAYQATGDIKVVGQLLGHSSLNTTSIYAMVSAEQSKRAVGLLTLGTNLGDAA